MIGDNFPVCGMLVSSTDSVSPPLMEEASSLEDGDLLEMAVWLEVTAGLGEATLLIRSAAAGEASRLEGAIRSDN
jgi:hypothetical protein